MSSQELEQRFVGHASNVFNNLRSKRIEFRHVVLRFAVLPYKVG